MASSVMPSRWTSRFLWYATTLALTLGTITAASGIAFGQTAKHYELAYDPRFIDKLNRADYAAIGTDDPAMASLFVLVHAYGAVDCKFVVADEDRAGYLAAITRLQTSYVELYAAVLLTAGMHPLYVETVASGQIGCKNERYQTVGQNLIHLLVQRTQDNRWDRLRASGEPARERRSPAPAPTQESNSSRGRRPDTAAPPSTAPASSTSSRREARPTQSADWPTRWRFQCETDAAPEGSPLRAPYLAWCRCTTGVLARALSSINEDDRKRLEQDFKNHVVHLELSRPELSAPLARCRTR